MNTLIKRAAIAILALIALSVQSGCKAPGDNPLNIVEYGALDGNENRRLLIILPGIRGNASLYEKLGFIDVFHEYYPDFDVYIADAHFGYYRNRSLLVYLENQIIMPAKKKGYSEIWMMGISLGGVGSLLQLRCCTGDIDGALLISPFLGDKKLHQQMDNAGGLEEFVSAIENENDESLESMWRWLYLNAGKLSKEKRLWLTVGEQDRYDGHDVLAGLMTPESVLIKPGSHNNKTFLRLWRNLLIQRPIPHID